MPWLWRGVLSRPVVPRQCPQVRRPHDDEPARRVGEQNTFVEPVIEQRRHRGPVRSGQIRQDLMGEAFRQVYAPARGLSLTALVAWMLEAGNDLQDAAIGLCPTILEVLRCLRGTDGCLLAAMSGSGATCFGVYDKAEVARSAASILRTQMPGWWSQAAVLLAQTGCKQAGR